MRIWLASLLIRLNTTEFVPYPKLLLIGFWLIFVHNGCKRKLAISTQLYSPRQNKLDTTSIPKSFFNANRGLGAEAALTHLSCVSSASIFLRSDAMSSISVKELSELVW